MDETDAHVDPGLSDQYRKASPWPLFVALGLAVSEVGVVLGLAPVSVGGLLLFGGSIAGILQESGYVERPWPSLAAVGALLVVGGALVIGSQVTPATLVADVTAPNSITFRGLAITGSGLILAVVGLTGVVLETNQ